MNQDQLFTVTTKVSIPLNQSSTGTAAVTGMAIVGTGTKFKTNNELLAGSYVVNLITNECRRVVRTDSDTIAFLEKPFSADILAGSAIQIIPHYKANPVEISMKVASGGTAEWNGGSLDGILTLSKANRDNSGRRDLIEPGVLNAFGTSVKVNILY